MERAKVELEKGEVDFAKTFEDARPKAVALAKKLAKDPFIVISSTSETIAMRVLRDLVGHSSMIYIEAGSDSGAIKNKCSDLKLDHHDLIVEQIEDSPPPVEASSQRISVGHHMERKDDY